jgi:peroxiredoxin-like protein
MTEAHYYDVNVQWIADRKGIMNSSVLTDKIEVATPPEFAKGMPNIWSPEHLLVAAVNSCLMTTFLAIAENSKLEFISFDSKAVGKLEIIDGKYIISEIELQPIVVISDIADKERTERVLVKSEKVCLISNSIKSTIIFKPEIKVS